MELTIFETSNLASVLYEVIQAAQPLEKDGAILGNSWLTPYQCYNLGKTLEKCNIALYGEVYKADKKQIDKIMIGTKMPKQDETGTQKIKEGQV